MLRHPSDFHRIFLCARGPLIPSALDRSRAVELQDRIGVSCNFGTYLEFGTCYIAAL